MCFPDIKKMGVLEKVMKTTKMKMINASCLSRLLLVYKTIVLTLVHISGKKGQNVPLLYMENQHVKNVEISSYYVKSVGLMMSVMLFRVLLLCQKCRVKTLL